jgi:hypothetical protein
MTLIEHQPRPIRGANLIPDDEPLCVCDTGFTCMSREHFDAKQYVHDHRVGFNVAGDYDSMEGQ